MDPQQSWKSRGGMLPDIGAPHSHNSQDDVMTRGIHSHEDRPRSASANCRSLSRPWALPVTVIDAWTRETEAIKTTVRIMDPSGDLIKVIDEAIRIVRSACTERSRYPAFVSTTETAQRLGLSKRSVLTRFQKGEIPASKRDGQWQAREWDLLDRALGDAPASPTSRPRTR